MAMCVTAATAHAQIISTLPSTAQVQDYTFRGELFTTFWGSTFPVDEDMLPATVAFDGTDVYWANPNSSVHTNCYIKGTLADGVITFAFPQQVASGRWANRLVRTSDDAYTYALESGVPNELTFTLAADGTITMDNSDPMAEIILAYTDNAGNWKNEGVFDLTLTPFTKKLLDAPATPAADWIMGYEGGSAKVKVAFEGDAIYVQGMSLECPQAWVKGTVADGKISFASDQYVGVDPTLGYRMMFYGCLMEMELSPSLGYEIEMKKLQPSFDMTYDADAQLATATNLLLCCPAEVFKDMPSFKPLSAVTLRPQRQVSDYTPAAPVITEVQVYPQYPNQGWDCVDVTLSDVNVDGQPLDTKNIYYRILLDGVPYILDPEEFDGVDEEMEWIPFGFTCYDLEDIGGTARSVSIYKSFVTEYAVEEKYVDGDKEYVSERAIFSTSGIGGVNAGDSAPEQWYDLCGRPVTKPASGIYIRRAGAKVSKVAL